VKWASGRPLGECRGSRSSTSKLDLNTFCVMVKVTVAEAQIAAHVAKQKAARALRAAALAAFNARGLLRNYEVEN